MPNKKINFQNIPIQTLELKSGHSYLAIMPANYIEGGEVGKALSAFCAQAGVKMFVLGPKEVTQIKIVELLEEK